MKLVEFNKRLSEKDGYTPVEITPISDADIEQFKSILVVNEKFKQAYDDTNSAEVFFMQVPFIKEIMGGKVAIEVFYACKAGFRYEGVPTKLTYELTQVFNFYKNEFPNAAIASWKSKLEKYLGKTFNGYTLLDIINNVYGKSFKLITEEMPKVINGNFTELYIPDVDRVAIIPNDIGDAISVEDCMDITYEKKLGICVKGIPIRRLGGRLGVTKDDFDLREVF